MLRIIRTIGKEKLEEMKVSGVSVINMSVIVTVMEA